MKKMRVFWEKYGFYISLAALIVMLGGSAVWYRSRQPAFIYAASTAEKVQEEHEDTKEEAMLFQWPLEGSVISRHVPNSAVYRPETGAFSGHTGIDISAAKGTGVHAVQSGSVVSVYKSPEYGCTVEIKSREGFLFRYGGLSVQSEVKVGDNVLIGQRIGCVGDYPCAESAFGVHLHFEIIKDGVFLDPEKYLLH